MLGKILNKIQEYLAVSKLKTNPAVIEVTKIIKACWTESNNSKGHSSEFIKIYGERMMSDFFSILSDEDPKMANRRKLCDHVLWYSHYYLISIDETASVCGHLGISGRLKPRILELFKTDEFLQKEAHAYPDLSSYEDALTVVSARGNLAYAFMDAHQRFRHYLKDVNPSSEKDWFSPLFYSQCANQEHEYRKQLGIPSGLSNKGMGANLKATAYGCLMLGVLRGDQYPDLEWDKVWSDSDDLESPRLRIK